MIDIKYMGSKAKIAKDIVPIIQGYIEKNNIRKLTPRERWRLMVFLDTDFDKAAKVNSNMQLYAQAGNSIVVNVLEGIFSQIIEQETKT